MSWPQRRIRVEESSQVGEARRVAASLSRQSGLSETDAGKVALVVNELGTNLLKHAKGGELLVAALPGAVEIIALDAGPGMNIEASLSDGHSTAGTRGEGLGAVKRAASEFDGWSSPGKGSVLRARIGAARSSQLQIGSVSVPIAGEDECGDDWELVEGKEVLRIAVTDGLGHGHLAARASLAALEAFRSAQQMPGPQGLVQAMHDALRPTRGAAVAALEIDLVKRTVRFAGLGNIDAAVVGPNGAHGLPSHNGIAGHEARRIQEFATPWPPRGILIAHTDGVSRHWKLAAYPGLDSKHAGVIAAVVYRDFRRARDDATVVAVKES